MPKQSNVTFNSKALDALRREWEAENPDEVFTVAACVEMLVRKMHEDKPRVKPRKKK